MDEKRESPDRRLLPRDLVGITALEIQLPTDVVTIPDFENVRNSAVGALIHFNRGTYTFPESDFFRLISQVLTADALCADHFLEFVGHKLCLPTTRFNLSNTHETIHKEVRDCYRLAMKVKLRFPPPEEFYSCKDSLNLSEFRTTVVRCCKMEFHINCIKRYKCPYCKEPWVALDCCVCGDTCTPKKQSLHLSYAALVSNRMSCCSADVHAACRPNITTKCPACSAELHNGHPVPTSSPHICCMRRYNLRQMHMARKELVAGY